MHKVSHIFLPHLNNDALRFVLLPPTNRFFLSQSIDTLRQTVRSIFRLLAEPPLPHTLSVHLRRLANLCAQESKILVQHLVPCCCDLFRFQMHAKHHCFMNRYYVNSCPSCVCVYRNVASCHRAHQVSLQTCHRESYHPTVLFNDSTSALGSIMERSCELHVLSICTSARDNLTSQQNVTGNTSTCYGLQASKSNLVMMTAKPCPKNIRHVAHFLTDMPHACSR